MREIEAKQWKLGWRQVQDSVTCTYLCSRMANNAIEGDRDRNRGREGGRVYEVRAKRFIIKLNFWQEILLYLFALALAWRSFFRSYFEADRGKTTFFTFHSIPFAISDCLLRCVQIKYVFLLLFASIFIISIRGIFVVSAALCVYWFTVRIKKVFRLA